jgi:CRP-like cAMP-binding protein
MVGESGLVADAVRDLSVSALTACKVFIVDRSALDPHGADAWRRPPVMTALEKTDEYTELKHHVITGMLETLPFFMALVSSRRAALASLMNITYYEAGSMIFREGDQGTRFYIVSDGVVEIHKSGSKYSGSRVVSVITPTMDRPWFGEVAMWMRKPRQGSAIVGTDARLLVIEEINFDAFLNMVPDFRPYLNKNHKQTTVHNNVHNKDRRSLEVAQAEEQKLTEQSNVAMKWQSGGRLGSGGKDDLQERSLYAERWERIVSAMLFRTGHTPAGGVRAVTTVSFRTADYVYKGPRAAADVLY